MALVTRNEYGIVAVNNSVLSKMIIDNLLALDDVIVPSTKKGKPIKKGFFTGYNDYANSIEIIEKNSRISVRVYVLSRAERIPASEAERFFDLIEEDFEILSLEKPARIILHRKGTLARQIQVLDEEIRRTND